MWKNLSFSYFQQPPFVKLLDRVSSKNGSYFKLMVADEDEFDNNFNNLNEKITRPLRNPQNLYKNLYRMAINFFLIE